MGFYDDEIKRLKNEKQRDEYCKECHDCAEKLRDLYIAFCDLGFTEDQAYELLKIQITR